MIEKHITPSLICMDMCNLETNIRELESVGCNMLHIDIVDGYFSESMPLGLELIKQVRNKTRLFFDAHVMAMDNSYIIEELLNIGVDSLCFQIETERHIPKKLSIIKKHGAQAGVALAPGTPLTELEYILEQCDFVLLMMINPGYASDSNEQILGGMNDKISDLYTMIKSKNLNTSITIDGRTYLEVIPDYIAAGANTIVAGSSCLFRNNGSTLQQNYNELEKVIHESIKKRGF